jgi:hypothetical protein
MVDILSAAVISGNFPLVKEMLENKDFSLEQIKTAMIVAEVHGFNEIANYLQIKQREYKKDWI